MKVRGMLCALMALLLMLPGAAMAQGAMGRYVEVPLNHPAEGYASFTQLNGKTYAVNGVGDQLYTSGDMLDWMVEESGHDEQKTPAMGGVNWIGVGTDGSLLLNSGWAMKDERYHPIIERIYKGASTQFILGRDLSWDTDRYDMTLLPSGELLALSTEAVFRFSPDGATQQRYEIAQGDAMAVYQNEVAVSNHSDKIITVYDLGKGVELRRLELPTAADYGLLAYDAQGALHYACRDGIYRVNAGGTLMVQIVDGRLSSLGKPSSYPRQLLFDADNNPVIVYEDTQSNAVSLIAYRFDENVSTEPNAALSVFALQDTDTLRECAAKFQKENPDVLVNITVGLAEGSAITRDDAIRTLNTEILAGQGPDVLVLDGLPVKSYIDKGVLKDLSSVVQPMIDQGLLTENLAGAYRRDGAIPAVPTRFLLPSIWGEVEGIDTLEDLANWSTANPDALPCFAVDILSDTLIGTFYLSSAPAWFNENGRLDEAKIEAFLMALKSIRGKWDYDTFVAKTGFDMRAAAKDRGVEMPTWNPYAANSGWMSIEENGGTLFMSEGAQKQLPFLLRGPDDVSFPNGALAGLKSGGFAALPGQAEGCFVPMLLMGATYGANSELAQRFIATALGEALQDADLFEGFPVHVKALDAAQTRRAARFGLSTTGSWSSEWPDQDARDKLRSIIDALKTPVTPDFTLYQMIVDESKPFFEGSIDARQAAANVCAKANAYLSE
ncbi:MAG: ABC transporter substrate-binding protein [Eubacteriales bacterium]|nr:ABC transporter substrate-binding protein [Christensenellaceae bacterium]MEA5066277.1 ABC transporter substrate-binding protein [Eubacteriales bacterium]